MMKAYFPMNNVFATLKETDEGFEWSCKDKEWKDILTRMTVHVQRNYSVADGEPKHAIFNGVVKELNGKVVINNEEVEESGEEIVH